MRATTASSGRRRVCSSQHPAAGHRAWRPRPAVHRLRRGRRPCGPFREAGGRRVAPVARDDQRRYAERLVNLRLHQPVFRARVIRAYDTSCAVCRLRHADLLDAAHIVGDAESDQPVLPNGLSLCRSTTPPTTGRSWVSAGLPRRAAGGRAGRGGRTHAALRAAGDARPHHPPAGPAAGPPGPRTRWRTVAGVRQREPVTAHVGYRLGLQRQARWTSTT